MKHLLFGFSFIFFFLPLFLLSLWKFLMITTIVCARFSQIPISSKRKFIIPTHEFYCFCGNFIFSLHHILFDLLYSIYLLWSECKKCNRKFPSVWLATKSKREKNVGIWFNIIILFGIQFQKYLRSFSFYDNKNKTSNSTSHHRGNFKSIENETKTTIALCDLLFSIPIEMILTWYYFEI